ncbi:MAG: GFA family protein [Alphaproteobacteria bacterium]|jgi:hypothetical protein|nr:GFA family protein [Alphaproteobacteria bacterium]MDP6814212.1 GFA family protein [Alphaproteobacteria bacterium]|tara:strand:+ start:452 stop:874 length:423 start_codon:yes stop_codon:yes gene_type:complete
MELTGGCLCGTVRYRISGEPLVVTHCHCATCRRASGAPFITWITLAAGDFAYSQGEAAGYRSSAEVERQFCATCGTSLAYLAVNHPEEIDISAGSLDEPERVSPQDHIWIGSKLPWINMDDGLPRLEGSHWQHGYPDKKK